jgi:hypothetical protein
MRLRCLAQMGVTNVSFSGRVRTSLTAISDRLPVVGSLQVRLMQKRRPTLQKSGLAFFIAMCCTSLRPSDLLPGVKLP